MADLTGLPASYLLGHVLNAERFVERENARLELVGLDNGTPCDGSHHGRSSSCAPPDSSCETPEEPCYREYILRNAHLLEGTSWQRSASAQIFACETKTFSCVSGLAVFARS